MQFMGYDGFIWFTGVVEERNDPLRLGRVRVRVFGLHTKKKVKGEKEGIPTEDLPWAYPMQPITSAAMNGVGTTPLGPVEGSHVVGFFRDGKNCQDPVVMGTLGGFPQLAPGEAGFNDPNALYPKNDEAIVEHDYLKEPDTNRRAFVEYENPEGETGLKSKPTALTDIEINDKIGERVFDKEVLIADGVHIEANVHGDAHEKWDEPEDPYVAQYPFNHVRESESGHVEEWDDSPDGERLMRKHKSGTFEEIHPDGQTVTKVVSDNYRIVMGDEFIHIKKDDEDKRGNVNITVEGSANLRIVKDWNVEVGGNVNMNVHGNWNETVIGDKTVLVTKTVLQESKDVTTIKGEPIHLNP